MERICALSMFLLFAVSCSDAPIGPTSQAGNIDVSVRTAGGDVDLDGYEIVTTPGVRTPVSSNASVMITGLSAGDHFVALDNVAANCLVGGTEPREARVVAGGTVAVVFEIECATTGIEVSIHTSGANVPETFSLLVNNQSLGPAGANGSRVVGRLATGDHIVELLVPGRCSVIGGSEVSATVSNRIVTKVSMEVTCGDVQRLEKVAYVLDSAASGYGAAWIVVANSDQTSGVPLVKGQEPDWSPDGTQLAFSELTCFTPPWDFEVCDAGLVVIDPETRAIRRLVAAGLASEPAWAPTGDVIAFVRSNEPAPRSTRLYLLKLDGSPAVEIPTPSVASVADPAWSPDGQRIAFTCVMRANIYDVCVINRNGTGLLRLTSDRQLNVKPAWSPDGTMIAFTTNGLLNPWDYGFDIAVMAANGSNVRRIASGYDPAWLPDGSKLVFAGPNGDGLLTVNPDGSGLTRRTAGRHHSPAWRPPSTVVPPTGGDPCLGCWDYSKIAAPLQRRATRD